MRFDGAWEQVSNNGHDSEFKCRLIASPKYKALLDRHLFSTEEIPNIIAASWRKGSNSTNAPSTNGSKVCLSAVKTDM